MYPISGPGATLDNKFTSGNPSSGTPATVVTDTWLNDVQAEILAVIVEAELEPDPDDNGQLLDAILALITGGGSPVTAAGVTIADAGDYFTGGNVELALQQLGAKIYAGTINSNQILRSVIDVTGATHTTLQTHFENVVRISHASAINYTIQPDADLTSALGTTIHVVQQGAGQITFLAGSGVTLLKGASFQAKSMEQHTVVVPYKVAANTWMLGGQLAAV